jgi:hypothetical protein
MRTPCPAFLRLQPVHCRVAAFVVELRGFEPLTFSLRTRRATNCAIAPNCLCRISRAEPSVLRLSPGRHPFTLRISPHAARRPSASARIRSAKKSGGWATRRMPPRRRSGSPGGVRGATPAPAPHRRTAGRRRASHHRCRRRSRGRRWRSSRPGHHPAPLAARWRETERDYPTARRRRNTASRSLMPGSVSPTIPIDANRLGVATPTAEAELPPLRTAGRTSGVTDV